jgi:hypothetical protein
MVSAPLAPAVPTIVFPKNLKAQFGPVKLPPSEVKARELRAMIMVLVLQLPDEAVKLPVTVEDRN